MKDMWGHVSENQCGMDWIIVFSRKKKTDVRRRVRDFGGVAFSLRQIAAKMMTNEDSNENTNSHKTFSQFTERLYLTWYTTICHKTEIILR